MSKQNEGTFGGNWQDEGIFFTIVVQSGIAVVLLLIICILHSVNSTSKILRPARPFSKWPRFLTRRDTNALLERDENEIAMRVSVFAAIQLLIIKYRAHVFLGGFFTAACICVIFGTDTFISSYAFRHDSYGCKGRTSSKDCSSSGVCDWNATGNTSSCFPVQLHGLQDLTLLNVTPTHFRSWLIGVFTVAFHVWFGFCIIKLMVEMRVLIFSAKTMPVQLESEKIALVAKAGSRTVRVLGISEEQCRAFDGSAASLFAKQIKIQTAKYLKLEDKASNGTRVEPTATTALTPGQQQPRPAKEQLATIAKLLSKKVTEAVVVYEAPETEKGDLLTDLIVVENEALDDLRVILAKKKEQDEKGADDEGCCACCFSVEEKDVQKAEDAVKKVQAKIKSLQTSSSKYEAAASSSSADEGSAKTEKLNPLAAMYSPWKVTQNTAAVITFDTSANAHKFAQLLPEYLKNYSAKAASGSVEDDEDESKNDDSSFSTAIAGPASHVLYNDLTPYGFGDACKTAILLVIYFIFIFFASVIIAFLGSIQSLASIPGLGDVFGRVVDALPVSLFRILQAYLPVIVVAIFQMLIPMLMHAIANSFRLGNWEQREASTFKFMFGYVFVTGVILQTALQGGIYQIAGLIDNASVTDALNFVVSLYSPKGGYFFALVASSAVFSVLMQALGIGNLVSAFFIAPHAALEEKRTVDQKPRNIEFDIPSALWMFIFSIGLLFHSTSPLLMMFVTFYFVAAYYTFRTLILDIYSRDAKTNVAVDATLSSAHATSQIKVILLLHSFTCIGTFTVFILKFLWGAAALTSVTLLINFYLWNAKWTTLDTMLDTTDLTLIDHYDHLLSRRSRSVEEKDTGKTNEQQQQQQPLYLPPFARDYKFNEYKAGEAKSQKTLIEDGNENAAVANGTSAETQEEVVVSSS